MKAGFSTKRFDYVLLFLILALLGLGVLMMASASFVRSSYLSSTSTSTTLMFSQFRGAIIGLAVMIVASFVDYHFYKRFAGLILLTAVALNLLTVFIGTSRNDATRWLVLGPVSFQPSELMKVAVILYIAAAFSDPKWGEKSRGWWGIVTVIIPFGLGVASVMLQKHLSATIIIGIIGVSMMIFAGIRWYIILSGVAAGGLLGGAVAVIKPDLFEHIGTRLTIFRHTAFGNINPEGINNQEYLDQIQNSLWAIGSGGFLGRGFGKSIQKYSYLSEAYNDFIFAIVAEELGYAGVVVILLLFALLIFRGIKISVHAPDLFGSLLSVGIIVMIAIQTVLNIAVVSCLIPVTGVALPFFSFGSTSMVIILGAMGILLNIAKQSNYSKI